MAWIGSTLLACGMAAAQGAPAADSRTNLIMPPTPLLPTNDRLVMPSDTAAVPADTPEAQTILKEDGLKRSESRAIVVATTGGKTTPSGWITAYEFGDATGAYAAYTYFRQGGDAVPHGINATDAMAPTGERVFLTDTSVVRAKVKLYPESLAAMLQSVAIGLPKIGGRRGLAPLLPTLLPAAALDKASVRYALGPVGYQTMGGVLPAGELGWDKSVEIATASYHGGKGKLTLLLYPTPQIAGDHGRAIEKLVNTAGPATFGTVKMRRVGPLVGLTSGGLSVAQASEAVQALRLNQQVTFDKKMPVEFHAEVRKTYTLLQSIAMFCGLAILASIVLGVFLGGARAGIRVLQGKPAASEPEFLSINLRGRTSRDDTGASGTFPKDPSGP